MRKYLAIFVAVLVVVLLAACAPKTGVVHDKSYSAGYWYSSTYCAVYGKGGACTMWMPQQHYQPPIWELDLYEGDKHGWRSVSEAQFNSVGIGDYYRG